MVTSIEGKSKIIESVEGSNDTVIMHFKDDITAFNGEKKDTISNKGKLCCEMSEKIYTLLEKNNIKTHFIEKHSDSAFKVKRLNMVPLEVVCRNFASGSILKRTNFTDKQELPFPLIEFFWKEKGDPLLNENHIFAMNLATKEDINIMTKVTQEVNNVLFDYFKKVGFIMADFKIEFGRTMDGILVLGDEFSPDNCRLWDLEHLSSYDKDVYRKETGNVKDTYALIVEKLI